MTLTPADIAGSVRHDALTADVTQIARRAVLDTSGAMLAGLQSAQADAVRHMAGLTGAQGAVQTALVLGTAAHALDFDDYEDVGSTHPSAPILAALFASLGARPVTIGDLLLAYVAGYETILLLGDMLSHAHYLKGWHATGTLGALGAAVAVARLLDLPAEGMGQALSIATSQASGLKRQFGTGMKAVHAGLAAQTGVLAAHLAASGLTAAVNPLEGHAGWAKLMGAPKDRSGSDRSLTIRDHPPYAKPWPCCGYTHRSIEAALKIQARLPRSPSARIVAIRLDMPDAYLDVAGFRAPRTEAEARFSTSYCVATALLTGALGPEDFHPAALSDPARLAMEARVTAQPYSLPKGAGDMCVDAPDRVEVTLSDGTVLSDSVAHVKGGPDAPLSDRDILDKFIACGGRPEEAHAFNTGSLQSPFQLFTGLQP